MYSVTQKFMYSFLRKCHHMSNTKAKLNTQLFFQTSRTTALSSATAALDSPHHRSPAVRSSSNQKYPCELMPTLTDNAQSFTDSQLWFQSYATENSEGGESHCRSSNPFRKQNSAHKRVLISSTRAINGCAQIRARNYEQWSKILFRKGTNKCLRNVQR